jgi:hypothetical protein
LCLGISKNGSQSTDLRCDHGGAAGHGLDEAEPETFAKRRYNNDIGSLEDLFRFVTVAQHPDRTSPAELMDPTAQALPKRAFACQENADSPAKLPGQMPKGLYKNVRPLFSVEPPHIADHKMTGGDAPFRAGSIARELTGMKTFCVGPQMRHHPGSFGRKLIGFVELPGMPWRSEEGFVAQAEDQTDSRAEYMPP